MGASDVEQGALVDAACPQHLGAAALEEAQVVGVVDDAGKICVLVIDPHRETVDHVVQASPNGFARSHLGPLVPAQAGTQRKTFGRRPPL